jgi:hypothetical protein
MIFRRALPLLIGLMLAPAAGWAGDKTKGTYLPIQALAATVTHAGGRHGAMTVDAGIDIPDPALRAYADAVQPRLRDAYAGVLDDYAGRLAPDSVPDIDYIARQLQIATDRVLGKPGGRLLVGGVMVN